MTATMKRVPTKPVAQPAQLTRERWRLSRADDLLQDLRNVRGVLEIILQGEPDGTDQAFVCGQYMVCDRLAAIIEEFERDVVVKEGAA